MRPIKSYVTDDLNTEIRCASCNRAKMLNVSGFIEAQSIIKFEAKCTCGNSFISFLERRKHYRKSTNLVGTFENCSKPDEDIGLLIIKDLSRTGMKLEISGKNDIQADDILLVQFHLDDAIRSQLNKMVIVKNHDNQFLGTEFAPTETVCKALSFYLLN